MEIGNIAASLLPLTSTYDDQIYQFTAEVVNLRAAIHAKSITDDSEILSSAYAIDAKLETWQSTLPAIWRYRTFRLPQSDPFISTEWGAIRPYGGCYHVYYSIEIIDGWCWYRQNRIYLGEIILNCFRRLFENGAPTENLLNHCRKLQSTMYDLAADICATVPYAFGIPESQGTEFVPGVLGGYMLALPLRTAGAVVKRTHCIREYTINYLQIIAHDMGIGHVKADIDVLKYSEGIVDWLDDLDGVGTMHEIIKE